MKTAPTLQHTPLAEAPRMAALSRAVLQLHRGSIDWPATAFDSRAIEAVATVLNFDACLWGSVPAQAPSGAALALQGLFVQGLDAQTLAVCLSGAAPGDSYQPGLSASHIEPLAARRVEMRLWRLAPAADESAGFSASDAQNLQFLLPHLVEAQRENRLGQAYSGAAPARARRSLALCDGQGVLQQVDEQGLALLRVEWPHWRGGSLPAPLLAVIRAATTATQARPLADDSETLLAPTSPSLSQSQSQSLSQSKSQSPSTSTSMTAPTAASSTPLPLAPYYGRGITVMLARSGSGVLLEVRRRTDADRLSARQRDIAQLYARGHTGPEIATRLSLSPSTVNNHLGVIFKKLAVKNKLQLLDAMRLDAEPF